MKSWSAGSAPAPHGASDELRLLPLCPDFMLSFSDIDSLRGDVGESVMAHLVMPAKNSLKPS